MSSEHQARHRTKLISQDCFGPFNPILEEYFADFVTSHYRDARSVRSSLYRFFRFLNEFGYQTLDDVNCHTITKFLAWAHKNNRGVRTDLLSCISTFFKWLQATGRRTEGNPVNSFLHRKRKEKRLPRPLSTGELTLAWELLHERGDARLRLAFAIGEESGLRIGEICRLRLEDVDERGRRLFVRLPNKTNRERYTHFGPKTARCLAEWLSERDSSCGTDHLIHNYARQSGPFTPNTLGHALNRVLRKELNGVTRDRGFPRWSTHRLRHTMGTNLAAGGADAAVLMAMGGWIDADSMAGYVKVNPEQVRLGYDQAMCRAEQSKAEDPPTRPLTPKEVLALCRGTGGKHDAKIDDRAEQRCV